VKIDFNGNKKLVIKIGSSLLVEDNKFRKNWFENFAENVVNLIKLGNKIVIVSSGAIALGKNSLQKAGQKLSLHEKQAAASIGQIQLMSAYQEIFRKFGFNIAQILLTAYECNSRMRYLNSQNTIQTLLKNNIIPIINENDSVAVDETKIGDNDRLAARISQMICADYLILLSDVDGLYDKNPRENKNAKLIEQIFVISKEIENMAGDSDSKVGTGGMITKIKAAKMATTSGCSTIITNGFKQNVLNRISEQKKDFTIFHSNKKTPKSRKSWIAGFINSKGVLIVNECAKIALIENKKSLLPVGVVKISGEFNKGDAVFIQDESGNHIASGISNYSKEDAKKIIGKNSVEVKKVFGQNTKVELIHIDNLVVIAGCDN
jgi:glutamate 5-kinase